MNSTKFKRRVSVFDVLAPFVMTEKRTNVYYQKINTVQSIEDITPSGNFIGRNRWLRIEVDSRFLTDEKALSIMDKLFTQIKTEEDSNLTSN